MMPSKQTLLHIAAGSLLTLGLLGVFAFRDDQKKLGNEVETRWQPPALPEEISFAGEAVPLDRWDVQERFDRELLFNYYSPANVLFLKKLSNRYFPIISERLQANGVPDDFKYLCVAESNLLSGATSRSGAKGFWQFMDATAPGYGLTANDQVDDRSDIIKSTDAACKYLKAAYQKFGSWTAAAASYNCGMGGYNGQATYQQTTNYYDLLLPEETNRYIFRILTFKHLLENSEKLGFKLEEKDLYKEVPYREVEVSSSIPNLAQFAIDNGTTFKVLRAMNPWLKGRSLTVSGGKTYKIKLPAAS
ncbi:Transglycosylase SLT domain-containing protein [Cnuella takakiae]|uniref:Transglycosylase SLT domain-containing protein n=1 Tax=Cnuella takakiae TaxID=1302690 RepID=A0A1M5BNC5_9BACT|nr:lytic transglycosylase domain-containing protein [Cnuella takakiae]SHF44028.1 Transglycosylase SLT domain-containing protein [Cnuella takakiae]